MSLHPTVSGDVPASTATVTRAAFPRSNPYLLLRDRLGTIFTDAQFAENLSDRRAADAVRSRIDWKYLLGWS